MDFEGWIVDKEALLGRGGFAAVYRGRDPQGHPVAAKIVPKQPGADRELLMEKLPAHPHIVPLIHVAESDEAWILFMPLAELSLRERLDSGPIALPEALHIMREISAGLAAIHEEMVHRDLKPENVLRLDGRWAISDFGISRYIHASTDEATQKFSMTAAYASPEQWRFERATPAADVYALGILSHELIGGTRPFEGPERDQYREQHLTGTPPRLEAPKAIATLIDEALFKAPEARPTIPNFQARLDRADMIVDTPAAAALLAAQQKVVSEHAAAHARLERERSEEERRESLRSAAGLMLDRFVDELVDHIASLAPHTIVQKMGPMRWLSLGHASMTIDTFRPCRPPRDAPANILAHSSIKVSDMRSKRSRGHSLYYGDLLNPSVYSWHELGFSTYPPDFAHEPRELAPIQGVQALGSGFRSTQLGWGIRPLDDVSIDDFIERWSELFGRAATDGLPQIAHLPDGRITPVRRG